MNSKNKNIFVKLPKPPLYLFVIAKMIRLITSVKHILLYCLNYYYIFFLSEIYILDSISPVAQREGSSMGEIGLLTVHSASV